MPAAAVVALAVVAYLPALQAGWVWDDDSYVTANPALRSLDGLRRIWVEPGAVAQYYPLTFTTLWLEYQVHGLAPLGYHATNVALHAATAVLVGVALGGLGTPAPFAVAALFAVHPLHVESVAWVTERKNVLSGVLFLAALACLVRWRDAAAAPARRRWYALGAAAFVGALLAKTVASTLPVVFLVAQWWRSGRVRRADVVAMLPLVAVGAALGSVTAVLERTHVGAVGTFWDQTPAERVLIAGRALWFYVGKLLWPHPLVFVYPRWPLDAGAAAQWVFPLAALAAGAGLALAVRRAGRGPLAAGLAYAALLGPALGFVNVYPMRYAFVADHFAYLASIPLLALGVGLAARRLPATAARGALVGVVAVLGTLTWHRCHAFRDAGTLWQDTLAKNPAATIAHVNLGHQLYEAGRLREALALFDQGLALEPEAADLRNNRALVLGALGRPEEALAEYRRAVAADPAHAEARSNLGNVLASLGRYVEAEDAYRAALRLRPRYPEAHNNLANVLALRGETAAALAHYGHALAADPGYVEAHRNLGEVLLRAGQPAEACARFAEVLRLRARDLPAAVGRVRCLTASGRAAEAVAAGTEAIRWAPGSAPVHLALADALARAGRGDEARAHYAEARALDPALVPAEAP